MTLLVILTLVIVVAVVGLIAWLPAGDKDHQPLVLRDGSRVVLSGGRRRLSQQLSQQDGGASGGWIGGASGGGDGGGGSG